MRESSPARATAFNPMPMPVRVSPSRKPVLPLYQEDELVHALKEVCNLEQEIENAKIQLAHKPDFNMIDAFQIFDQPRYGAVDVH